MWTTPRSPGVARHSLPMKMVPFQLPVETLIAMRNETMEPLRQAGFFSLPHPKTVSPASANVIAKRQFLSDAILSQVRSLNIKKSHPVVEALSSLDKLESQFEEVKKQQRELPQETSAADRKQIQDRMTTIFWQGVEVVDQVIALVEEPTADLSKKFADHAATLDLQESQVAAQQKVIDEYISSHRPELAKRATTAMKRKRAPASPARQGKQRGTSCWK